MTTRSGSSRPDLDTGQWKRIRAAVRRRDGNVCVVCGRRDRLSVHHVVPARLGGADGMDNLVTVCVLHHRQADARLQRTSVQNRGEAEHYLPGRSGTRHLLGAADRAVWQAATMVEALVRLAARGARATEPIVASLGQRAGNVTRALAPVEANAVDQVPVARPTHRLPRREHKLTTIRGHEILTTAQGA
jgi:hypothetical protein